MQADTAQQAYITYTQKHHRAPKTQVEKVGRFIIVAQENKVVVYGCPTKAAQSLGLAPSKLHEQLGVECETDDSFKIEAR